jgi:hypothetical protein
MTADNLQLDEVLDRKQEIGTLKYYQLSSLTPPHEVYLRRTAARMAQLDRYHAISQEYILPIPYLCQIYHLLDLKHLEQVHGFSLSGLKVSSVSQFEPTANGGIVRFKTTLDRSLNILRFWRHPVVEVDLILHTPYTVELSIPIYRGKKITIIFNVLPLGDNNHKLFIDIYSDLRFPKPILQMVLHLATCLTVVEDLPYLRKLADGNFHRRVKSRKFIERDTMKLFKRFVDLYGSSFEQPHSVGAIELRPLSHPA